MGKGSGYRDTKDYHVRGGHAIPEVSTYQHAKLHETSPIVRTSTRECIAATAQRHVGPKGLMNVGNTCYANAVLQCLLSTALTHALVDPSASAIFRRYSSNQAILEQGSGSVDSDEDLATDPIEVSANSGRRRRERAKAFDEQAMLAHCQWLSRELNFLTEEYHAPEPNHHSSSTTSWLGANKPKVAVVDPGFITRNPHRLSPCLKPYQQEDAHEFLRALLGTLVMHGHNKELSSLFDGLLESAVVCQTCRRPSLTRDRYMDLSLDIEQSHIQTLEDALKEFTKTEILTGENKVHCSRCESKRTATKGLRLATAPSILVAHLKRFGFDKFGRLHRLDKKVKFPLRLEIADYMSRFNKARPPPYELVAVLVHQGVSCEYGHYVAYVKQCGDWYLCNDSTIQVVDVETVLNQQAYILMYEVAEMREKHGFPSPNKSVKKSEHQQPRKIEGIFSMLCGIDYGEPMFGNVCQYASSFGRKVANSRDGQSGSGGQNQKGRTRDDDDIVLNEKGAAGAAGESRRGFRRSSSSGNLSRLNALPNDDRFQSRSVSLHRRHRRMESPTADGSHGVIKKSLSPVYGKRRGVSRIPGKGELPPRPAVTPICTPKY